MSTVVTRWVWTFGNIDTLLIKALRMIHRKAAPRRVKVRLSTGATVEGPTKRNGVFVRPGPPKRTPPITPVPVHIPPPAVNASAVFPEKSSEHKTLFIHELPRWTPQQIVNRVALSVFSRAKLQNLSSAAQLQRLLRYLQKDGVEMLDQGWQNERDPTRLECAIYGWHYRLLHETDLDRTRLLYHNFLNASHAQNITLEQIVGRLEQHQFWDGLFLTLASLAVRGELSAQNASLLVNKLHAKLPSTTFHRVFYSLLRQLHIMERHAGKRVLEQVTKELLTQPDDMDE